METTATPKATSLHNFFRFMTNGGWTKDTARLIFGEEKGGELFRKWAHYTKFMLIDSANYRFAEVLFTEDPDALEAICDWADEEAEMKS